MITHLISFDSFPVGPITAQQLMNLINGQLYSHTGVIGPAVSAALNLLVNANGVVFNIVVDPADGRKKLSQRSIANTTAGVHLDIFSPLSANYSISLGYRLKLSLAAGRTSIVGNIATSHAGNTWGDVHDKPLLTNTDYCIEQIINVNRFGSGTMNTYMNKNLVNSFTPSSGTFDRMAAGVNRTSPYMNFVTGDVVYYSDFYALISYSEGKSFGPLGSFKCVDTEPVVDAIHNGWKTGDGFEDTESLEKQLSDPDPIASSNDIYKSNITSGGTPAPLTVRFNKDKAKAEGEILAACVRVSTFRDDSSSARMNIATNAFKTTSTPAYESSNGFDVHTVAIDHEKIDDEAVILANNP